MLNVNEENDEMLNNTIPAKLEIRGSTSEEEDGTRMTGSRFSRDDCSSESGGTKRKD